ncbi:retrovirus-related pol polyprotein from transposon TNT 1-94 [Tanacetum coccineum]
MSNTNNNLQTQTSNALHNAIMEAGGKDYLPMLAPGSYNPPYKFKWTEKTVLVVEGSSETTIEGYMENYKNVSQDIRNQLDAEAEVVQIILTGIDNDIYSTFDACPNACKMWKANKWLKQGESINVQDLDINLYWEFGKFTSRDEWQRFVTLVKQSQELKIVSYHKLYDILKQHQNEVNELRGERLARTANPLALFTQQQPVYHPQNHPNHYTHNSLTRSQQDATRNRGKAIANSPPPTYDQEPTMVAEDDEMSKEKEIDKLMALISLSFNKIYKPTNNNLKTSSNTSRANQDNTPRINKGTRYDNQRVVNVAGDRENVEQADWRDDTDDEPDDQELKAHYLYMAQIQEVTPDAAANSGPIFDAEPLQKVQNDDDNYNVFANEREHPDQPESVNDIYPDEQDKHNIIIDSLDMSHDREQDDQDDDDLTKERDLLASLIEKLKCEIDDNKNRNKFLESSKKALVDKLKGEIEDFKSKNKSLESSNNHFKEANNELYHDVNYVSKVEINCAKAKELKKELFAHQETISIISQEKEAQNKFYKTREDKEIGKEQLNNDKVWKQKELNSFRELNVKYFEIQDLKAQLQDKDIAISELKKLNVEMNKRISVETKFEKPSVIRQLNAFKSQRQLILGKPTTFSDSLAKKYFSKSKSVNINNVSTDFSKPITAQILPQNVKSILKNTNVIAPGMYKVHTKPNQTRTPQFPQDISKTNKCMSFSTGVIPTTSVSRPQLKSNQSKDRVMSNNSQGKKQEVEDHHRNFKFSKNKTYVTACNDSLNAKTSHVDFVCVTCGKCVLNNNHDMCVLHYINGVNSRTKMPMAVPICTREPKRTVNQSVATPLSRTLASESTNKKPRSKLRKQYEQISKTCKWWYSKITPPGYKWKPKTSTMNVKPNIIEIILFIIDSGCSKHMTGNLKLLIQGNITIKKVYYVEGLNHNLFSIGQFCDADLEVAFLKSTFYIRDLKGNDLLTATSSQAWLWHRHLSHLNFDTINFLLKYDIVTGLPKLKFVKDHLCSSCELGKAKCKSFKTKTTPSSKRRLQILHMDLCGPMRVDSFNARIFQTDKGMKFLNKTLHAYFAQKGIEHQTSTTRTPEQNSVVERQNRTLVELARTMLSATKVPFSDPVPQRQTTALEQENLSPGPQSQKNVPHAAKTVTTSNELDLLFSVMFDELLNDTTLVVSKSSAVTTAGAPNQHQHHNTTSSTSITISADIHPLNIQTTPKTTNQAPTQVPTITANENIIQAETNKEYA